MKWQPIETAPDNGKEIILSGTCLHAEPTMYVSTGYTYNRKDWFSGSHQKIYTPTHWMPLPTPPEES